MNLGAAARGRRAQARAGQLAPVPVVPRRASPMRETVARRSRGKFAWWRPTCVQREMLSNRASRRLLRGPNQIGKTEAMCADVTDIMLGVGRWQPERALRHPPPVDIWVVCTSWKQSLVIQRKLNSMIPPEHFAQGTKYTKKRGFAGQSFQLTNGSLCSIVTINQDTENLASATLDAVFIDEVPTEEAWGELVARVRHKGGQIAIYFTPINRPVEWVREKVAAKEIVEVHSGLTEKAVWPEGALRPFQTQAQLDAFAKDVPPWQRAQRVHGEWEGATEGRWIADYDPTRHTRQDVPADWGPVWELAVGFDWGLKPGKMSAMLVAVKAGHTTRPEVWFMDEEVAGPDEIWSMEEMISRVLAMIERNHLTYDDIDQWVGDRSAEGRTGKISNRDAREHLAAALGRTHSQVKAIDIPRKGGGSVSYGCALINAVFGRDAGWVSPRCVRFREFLSHFAGGRKDKTKDAGDAGRYAFCHLVNPAAWYRVGRWVQ